MSLRNKKHWFIKYFIFAMLMAFLFTGNARVVNAESVVDEQEIVSVLYDYTESYGWKPGHKDGHVKVESVQNSKAKREVVYLSVFVTFPDVTSILDQPESLEAAELLLNTGGEVTNTFGKITVPSLKQLVEKVTYGKLSTTSHIFPRESAGSSKVVSFTAPHPRSYYLKKTASNPNGYQPSQQRVREAELVEGAVNAMKEQVAAEGITQDQLDSDNDGAVDAISFFIGGGMDNVGWSDLLWSHKIEASAAPLPSNPKILGKRISAWNLITGNGKTVGGVFSKNRPSYAVIFHEYLHTLGLPDLYRGVGGPVPVGVYDVMAESTAGYPQDIMAVMAEDRSWHNPLPEVSQTGTVTLTKPKYKDPSEKNSVKIRTPYSDKEYFVAEFYVRNELQKKYADGGGKRYSDSDGLIISRVKTDEYNGNLGKGPGTDMLYVFRPGETVPSEGRGQIEQAALSIAKNRTRLGKAGNGGGFDNETIYLSDGTNSGVVVEVTAETADTITFNVTIPSVQGTGTEKDPYLISKPSDFELIRNLPDKHFKITKDIDFSGVNGFTPLERLGDRKPGVLDGSGKTIKNLTIDNPPGDVAGLFQSIGVEGVVKNLTFENLNVTDRGVQVGGVAASSGGTIENVTIKSGSMTNTAEATDFRWNTVVVGGLVGYLRDTATISNSYNSASVTGKVYAGGLVGDSQNGSIVDSYVNGAVQSPKNGGIIGRFRASSPGPYKTRGTYYDQGMTGMIKGISESEGSVAVPADSGITSVKGPNEIVLDLDGANEKELVLTFDSASGAVTAPLEISIADTKIATVNSANKIVGVSAGTTQATARFRVGPHKMGLETNVVVTGSAPANPVPTATDLKADLSNRTYNKTPQPVTVSEKDGVTGLGRITVKYKKGSSPASNVPPIQAGAYEVLVDIAEGSSYQAASDIALGTYTIDPALLTAARVVIPDVLMNSTTQLVGQTLKVQGSNIAQGDTVNATNCTITFPSTAAEGVFLNGVVTVGRLDNGNYRIGNNRLENQSYKVVAVTVDEIRITSAPHKTSYFEGEKFDATGMSIKGIWSDGTESNITDQVEISPNGDLSATDVKVVISYKGRSVEQAITVKKVVPVRLEIATPPTKVEYVEGEVFDPTGLALTLVYDSGSTEAITKDYKVSEKGVSLGTTEVEISYEKGGKVFRVSQRITVRAKPEIPKPEEPKPEIPKPELPTVEYPDVKAEDWFYSAVNYVASTNIMSGYADGTFGASDQLGRAQFSTILHRMEGSPEVRYEGLFSDVPAGQFYSLPVVWASTNKVITGYENGMFGTSDSITREQLATIMYRYAKYRGKDATGRVDLSRFPDQGKVSSFAKDAMSWAVAEGIISGDQGNLNPQGVTSRAVAAIIIQRFQE